jgi:hypothetical protein
MREDSITHSARYIANNGGRCYDICCIACVFNNAVEGICTSAHLGIQDNPNYLRDKTQMAEAYLKAIGETNEQ